MAHENVEVLTTQRDGAREGFLGIYVAMFIVFLMLALASLVFAQNWRSLLPGAEGARSVLGGVKSAVYTVMSQLS